jgi:hypothetical protein
MKTVTKSRPPTGGDAVTTAHLAAEAAEAGATVKAAAGCQPAEPEAASGPGTRCRLGTRDQAHRALPAWFTAQGWTPAQLRAAEHMFFLASPVADAMERLLALRVTCEAAVQHVPCGLDGCGACAGLPCDGETAVHVVRLGSAMKRGVISGTQFADALRSAVIFTGSTVICPDGAR